MATAPKPGARNRDREQDLSVTVRLDDQCFTFRLGEMSALDAGALRRATGLSFPQLMRCANDAPDLDTAAALIWLARRQNGEPTLAYETVAAGVTPRNAPSFVAEEDDDSPEA